MAEVSMDYDAVQKMSDGFRTSSETLEGVSKALEVAIAVLKATAMFGMIGNAALAMYLEDVFTLPTNLAGVPGLAFPVGFDSDHLPVGMQLMGPHYKEEILFKAAFAYQRETNWHSQSPIL